MGYTHYFILQVHSIFGASLNIQPQMFMTLKAGVWISMIISSLDYVKEKRLITKPYF